MRNILLVSLPLLFTGSVASAFELEGFLGANSTTYDQVSDANSYGLSVRTKLNFYGDTNHGFFSIINARGESIAAADLFVGYAYRTSGTWFVEGGGGYDTSAIFGSGVGVLVGTGAWLSKTIFIDFPMTYGTTGIFWCPYVGIRF